MRAVGPPSGARPAREVLAERQTKISKPEGDMLIKKPKCAESTTAAAAAEDQEILSCEEIPDN